MKSAMRCNYHTHSVYCDGKDEISAFVEEATHLQYNQLGFSSHAPVPFENDFGITEANLPRYYAEIEQLKSQTQTELFTGLECDFIPEMTQPFSYYQEKYHLDFIIGGVHLVKPEHDNRLWFIDGSKREIYDDGLDTLFNHNVQVAVTRFWEQTFEMIETQKFDIIAHMDKIKMHNQKRFFSENESWYLQLIDHCLKLLKEKNIIVEINSRGIYKQRCPDFYPSDYILQRIASQRIPMVISTDAHKTYELSMEYDHAVSKLKSFGINYLMYIHNGQWEEYSI